LKLLTILASFIKVYFFFNLYIKPSNMNLIFCLLNKLFIQII